MKILPFREHRAAWALLAMAVAFVALTLAWKLTPLSEWLTAERVVEWVETFTGFWWAPYALALLYTPASVVLFPRALLTVAAAMAFGPWVGFAVAMGGVLLNTAAGYAAGLRLDPGIVKRWGGEKLERVGHALRKEGLLSVATICVVPLAPFFVELLAFGALRLKFWHVMAGVALSNTPGLLASTLLGDQVHAILAHDRTLNAWVIAAVVAMLALMAFVARRLWKQMRPAAG